MVRDELGLAGDVDYNPSGAALGREPDCSAEG
jgi:hypothetical protein